MKLQYFKLVPVSCAAEIPKDAPFVVTWKGQFQTSPCKNPDYARHIVEGSAAVHNLDTLIQNAEIS